MSFCNFSFVRASLCSMVLSALALGACADAEADGAEFLDPNGPADETAKLAAAAVTGTLACNLEYMAFSPSFVTRPVTSFSQPMSVVASSGVAASNGTYTLSAGINPSTSLSFQVGVYRVSTGRDVGYLVLPPQSPGPGFLFENAVRITTVTVGGVAYDHLRTYCQLIP